MAEYKVYFKESVEKDLGAIPKKDLKRVLRRVEMLSQDPRPQGHEKLTGQERYRVRQGHNRIVYSIQDQELTVWSPLVVKGGHRKEVYR
jgi:mRNA interferase RelE/StbE